MAGARGARRGRGVFIAALAVACGTLSCGASIQAVYEGNVRFEHCMAMDTRDDVKPTIRRACWEEWVTFYTFGQTRDRVDYARQRNQQLVGASDFDEGEWRPLKRAGEAAVPEPTSALAPPPMMLQVDGGSSSSDGGVTGVDGGRAAPAASGDKPPANAECTGSCESAWTLCQHDCKTPNCEKSCQGKYKKCMKACF